MTTRVAHPHPRVAVMQMGYDRYGPEGGHRYTLEQNGTLMDQYLGQAGDQGADLVIAPECWVRVGLDKIDVEQLAVAIPGDNPIYNLFAARARRHHMSVVGWAYERDGKDKYNTAFVIGPDGNYLGKYRKTHPVPGEETQGQGIRPGNAFPVFDLPLGRIGIMICFDNYFPEVSRILAVKGARLICYPTMNSPRLSLETRAAARAIDNGCYVACSVLMGYRLGEGSAAIYDPRGETIAGSGSRDGVVTAEIDLTHPYPMAFVPNSETYPGADRHQLLLAARRPEIYGELLNPAQLGTPNGPGTNPGPTPENPNRA